MTPMRKHQIATTVHVGALLMTWVALAGAVLYAAGQWAGAW